MNKIPVSQKELQDKITDYWLNGGWDAATTDAHKFIQSLSVRLLKWYKITKKEQINSDDSDTKPSETELNRCIRTIKVLQKQIDEINCKLNLVIDRISTVPPTKRKVTLWEKLCGEPH